MKNDTYAIMKVFVRATYLFYLLLISLESGSHTGAQVNLKLRVIESSKAKTMCEPPCLSEVLFSGFYIFIF